MTQTVATPDVDHPSKLATELELGDWISGKNGGLTMPLRVVATYEYDDHGPLIAITYVRSDAAQPEITIAEPTDRIWLATAAERASATDADRRAKFLNDLRTFTAWFEARPWLPVPYARGFQGAFVNDEGLYADLLAEAGDLAHELGVKADVADDHLTVRKSVGSVTYTVHSTRTVKAVDPKPVTVTEMVAAREIDNADEPEPVPDFVDGNPMTGRPVSAPPAIRSDESIVDLGSCKPVMRYFSFGGGQTDPATGENLLDKYVTVVAPTAEGCREAMLASRFGREWSFEYIPGTPKSDEWIARWTEHDRIVVVDHPGSAPESGVE